MKTKISLEQYENDFKEVLLFFTCKTIHEFFDDCPRKMFQTMEDYRKVRQEFEDNGTKISKNRFFKILQNMIYINNGVGLPFHFVKAMFHKSDGTQSSKQVIDEMIQRGELKKLKHGVLKSKVKTHFTVKYLLPIEVLEDFFADKDLAKIKLDNRRLYWTKRQNNFIGKEIDRRTELQKNREVCAVKKQTEKEDEAIQEEVDALVAEMDI